MYLSNGQTISLTESQKNARSEAISRLYQMEFNLVPLNGKQPFLEGTKHQKERVTVDELIGWMKGTFISKKGKRWKPKLLNFGIVTGAIYWSKTNGGIIVIDSDDDEAEGLVRERCPETPMMQKTGSGGFHRVYRRPSIDEFPHIANRQKTFVDGKQFNLDIRGDGGCIVCPMSIHPASGSFYTEIQPWTLELLAQCPVYDPSWIRCEKEKTDRKKSTVTVASVASPTTSNHDELISAIEMPIEERVEMARPYLRAVPGTQVGAGADKKCTALTMTLLFGFALPVERVLKLLVRWGKREDQLDENGNWFPWEKADIQRKIDWCLNQKYRGVVGDRLDDTIPISNLDEKLDQLITPIGSNTVIKPADQLQVANQFFQDCFVIGNQGTLVHHLGCWHHWTGKKYEVISDDDIKARLWKWLSSRTFLKWGKVKEFQPTRSIVSNVLDALRAVCHQLSVLEAPCWLSTGPANVIAFDNGLLDVDGFLDSNQSDLLGHSPNWFSANCLTHSFDAQAICPQWLEFLNQVFDGDQERIQALQEWFGYCLTTDNRQQKIALLVGPPRSGKGTTIAILSALLGKHNIASVSMSELAGSFGLQPLLGKTAAIIDEGHVGKFLDTASVLERLKAISGGSDQTVNRKGLAALPSVSLKVRFTLAVNELPRLSDSSAAMRSRLLVIPYFNTYEGKEDIGLVGRLLTEISGITNWALEGLHELYINQRFQIPTAGEQILRDFVYLSSPVKAFIDECCLVNNELSVSRKHLQFAWSKWCDENGHLAGSGADLGKKLRAVVPKIRDEYRRSNGGRERWYVGIGLNPDFNTDIINSIVN